MKYLEKESSISVLKLSWNKLIIKYKVISCYIKIY